MFTVDQNMEELDEQIKESQKKSLRFVIVQVALAAFMTLWSLAALFLTDSLFFKAVFALFVALWVFMAYQVIRSHIRHVKLTSFIAKNGREVAEMAHEFNQPIEVLKMDTELAERMKEIGQRHKDLDEEHNKLWDEVAANTTYSREKYVFTFLEKTGELEVRMHPERALEKLKNHAAAVDHYKP